MVLGSMNVDNIKHNMALCQIILDHFLTTITNARFSENIWKVIG